MRNAPHYELDLQEFWKDPYPDLKRIRELHPVVYVPQLGAFLLTHRDDIYQNEKKTDILSSVQPEGLMVQLMGQNMMRKDAEDHQRERRAIFPTVSPKTVKSEWKDKFENETDKILNELEPAGEADFVKDIAMRISGEALKIITGLTQISWEEMDRVSQGMIDGCANYVGDVEVEETCHQCTAAIDKYITEMMPIYERQPNNSLLSVQMRAGLPEEVIRANVKLAISGGQNEPRDVIAGTIWALLNHPEQLDLIRHGKAKWMQAFNEYTRWISPVGMSPRRVAKSYELHGVDLQTEDRVFLMFGIANRDPTHFRNPDHFDITQDSSKSVAFGAGPHFCAGAAASKSLIGEVVLPSVFERLPNLRLNGETTFGGWAFRGPLQMPVQWRTG
nr:cytochrome P450 [Hyphomonas sp. Mor2]